MSEQEFVIDPVVAPIAKLDLEDDDDDLVDDVDDENDLYHNSNTNRKLNETKYLCSSLENLVQNFETKLKTCLTEKKSMDISDFAPVQVRTHDEIMNASQIWYTLTGNFGDILPIDWAKTLVNKDIDNDSECSSLCENRSALSNFNVDDDILLLNSEVDPDEDGDEDEYDDQLLPSNNEQLPDVDLKADLTLKLERNFNDEPIFTAEQVLNEIECMMQQDDYYDESTPDSGFFPESACDLYELNDYTSYVGTFQKKTPEIGVDELSKMTNASLADFISQLEKCSEELSSTLVNELALLDEFQYEKELKNTFITLVSEIESKRQLILSDSILCGGFNKRQKHFTIDALNVDLTTFNLTTRIPYDQNIELNNQNLQTLIKLLQAINEDSHEVTELLTDYILKVVCPNSS